MCIMFRDKWIIRFFEFLFCGDFSLHLHKMVSLRSMAVLSSRAQERRSREIRARSARERGAKPREKLLPPQSPRGFSALSRLYYLARPTKTAMLRRL